MSSVQRVILNLLSGIDDAEIRIEVSRTLMYLNYVYASGKVDDMEVRKSVEEVVATVLKMKHPELSPEEFKKLVKKWVEEVMSAFRTQALFSRTAARVGL